LESFFIHVVSEIAEGGGQDKAEKDDGEDDDDFNPFESCEKRDREKEYISGKRDEDDDQHCVFRIEWEVDGIDPDGIEDHNDDDRGDDPPE
jgi:hypothetical protein